MVVYVKQTRTREKVCLPRFEQFTPNRIILRIRRLIYNTIAAHDHAHAHAHAHACIVMDAGGTLRVYELQSSLNAFPRIPPVFLQILKVSEFL